MLIVIPGRIVIAVKLQLQHHLFTSASNILELVLWLLQCGLYCGAILVGIAMWAAL